MIGLNKFKLIRELETARLLLAQELAKVKTLEEENRLLKEINKQLDKKVED